MDAGIFSGQPAAWNTLAGQDIQKDLLLYAKMGQDAIRRRFKFGNHRRVVQMHTYDNRLTAHALLRFQNTVQITMVPGYVFLSPVAAAAIAVTEIASRDADRPWPDPPGRGGIAA